MRETYVMQITMSELRLRLRQIHPANPVVHIPFYIRERRLRLQAKWYLLGQRSKRFAFLQSRAVSERILLTPVRSLTFELVRMFPLHVTVSQIMAREGGRANIAGEASLPRAGMNRCMAL